MQIKKIEARSILDSRKEPTVEISVKNEKGKFVSSAPSGKSKGRFEAKPYLQSIQKDIDFLNNLKTETLRKLRIEEFRDLKEVEGLVGKNIGANSLFALESSILKALASEQGQELWELLSRSKKPKKFPAPVGNAIGGGLHTQAKNKKKPDIQEFLFINKTKKFFDRVFLNKQAYNLAGKILEAKKVNDEGAWITDFDNDKCLQVMSLAADGIEKELGERIDIGIDVAASSFFVNKIYNYKNPKQRLNKERQINFIARLSQLYELHYIEDGLEENDFYGFAELRDKTKAMIVGDDLTVTNMTRLKKAVQNKAISALIVKPNQNGSLLKVKEICDFCIDKGIKIVFSHRSGETQDTTIADLAFAWKADFIKTGIFGKEREAKLNRLIQIEKSL